MADVVHVVAGVLRDAQNRILLTERPPGKHLAGLWEFPGGKCEPGEASAEALRRELDEELGIAVGSVEPLIAVPWRYAEKTIVLDVFLVRDYSGEPHGREAQRLRWVACEDLADVPMPPADRPVVAALRLPRHYVITQEPESVDACLRDLGRLLEAGWKFIQLRSKRLPRSAHAEIVHRAHAQARAAGATLLLNLPDGIELARELDGAGVHLPAAELMRSKARPLPLERWIGASCHDAAELVHAAAIGVDFAVLGPVLPTASHPGAATLGWAGFAELCAAAPLPVYALGGLALADLPRAVAAGGHGVAGISAFA
ncbi:MAG TPA: Nudix family hydrolase [Rudaea sp.]|nr:Nudix family hydrolase [Rudaea sp.]